ncbi:MAG: hypothetical protein NT154_02285, partial [Verrucomicrobia bacterium]|nr:hypothetical protein [Verrucomicrobiota bacterium]
MIKIPERASTALRRARDWRSDADHINMKILHKVQFWLCFITLCSVDILAGQALPPEPKMTFLDNGEVRIGMDLGLGGAVTFISSRDHPGNIINSADLGRQIQMSHYSGPWPFEVGEKKPHKAWAGLGWNPIQTGDCYMNPSKVIEHRNDGKQLYIKCIPMQWPLDNVPGDCVFETWTRLEGPVIHMRYRCTNQRSDPTAYRPCPQELPAVYTVSTLCRLMSYTGSRPFTQDALTQVTNDWRKPWPWTRFVATERWAALVDSKDWGLGVFKDEGGEFHGGIYGDARSDDPKDGSTAYLAPIHMENFDHNIVYEHRTTFVVGSLADIRKRFNEMATRTPPAWRFVKDRQHWTLRNAMDGGFPLNGEWRIKFGANTPHLASGVQTWRAETAPAMELEMAYTGQAAAARVFWQRLDDDQCDKKKSLVLDLIPDGKFHTYHLDLASAPEYRGLIIGVAIETVAQPRPGEELAIKSIVFSPAVKTG